MNLAATELTQYPFGTILSQSYTDISCIIQDYIVDIKKTAARIPMQLEEDKIALLYAFNHPIALAGEGKDAVILQRREFGLLRICRGSYLLKLEKGVHKILIIELSKKIIQTFSSAYKNLPVFHPPIKENNGIHLHKSLLVNSIEKSYKSLQSSTLHGEPWEIFRQSFITKIIIDSLNELDTSGEMGNDGKFTDVKTFILSNLDKKLDLPGISRKLQILPETLRKGFKRAYGYNLLSYIRKERMLKAAKLLVETDIAIQEVAWEVGYESPTAFTRIFSSFHGCAPNDFRIKNRI